MPRKKTYGSPQERRAERITDHRPYLRRVRIRQKERYAHNDTRHDVVGFVDPEGRVHWSECAPNARPPWLQVTSRGAACDAEYSERGWSLLADLYDREPDDFRRIEGSRAVDEYIRAWRYHPSGENRVGRGYEKGIPAHLLPQEVLDRREGLSGVSNEQVHAPPDPEQEADEPEPEGEAVATG